MATFFGEIRPLSSRAIDDEEADNQPNYKVSIDNSDKKGEYESNIKLMIFAVGEIASIYVKSNFIPDIHNLVCTVTYTSEERDDDSTFYTGLRRSRNAKNVIASVFTSCPGVLICITSGNIPEEICFETSEIIFKKFSPAQVLILTSQNMASFRKDDSSSFEMPFLKSLGTSQYMVNASCRIPRLNPPNFLSNIPASLLLKCEISKLPALCVVNYLDINTIDSINVEVFNDILKESIVSQMSVNHDANSKVIRYVKEKLLIESTLYT